MVRRSKHPEVCEVFSFDQDKVQRLKGEIGVMDGLSEVFKVLGDEARTKILFALSQEELCVCDIANILGLSVSTVSHHLRLLRGFRLVKHRRVGRMVFYSLDDQHIVNLIHECLEHIKERR
ncbi:MAG: winged helix-turn-helix transcriptional regulator [candidate division NC10 bacterium]|nr:winged helix-turn-helix transcriptional regulator [candidate division NC10 bacterium]